LSIITANEVWASSATAEARPARIAATRLLEPKIDWDTQALCARHANSTNMNKGLCAVWRRLPGSRNGLNSSGMSVDCPKIVAGKAYMRPAERSDVSEQIIGRIDAVRAADVQRALM